MEINNLQDLFGSTLSAIYDAERILCRILPGLADYAGNEALAEILRQHRNETEWQMKRLNRITDILGLPRSVKRNEAIRGIIAEFRESIGGIRDKKVLDVALVTSVRKIKHYEIATYSSLSSLAMELGHTQIGEMLNQSLIEEEKTDETLLVLAREGIYEEARKRAA